MRLYVFNPDHLIAAVLLLCAGLAGLVAMLASFRARDIAFFVIAFGAVITNRMDVNFLSEEWYRGTTRGIEMTGIDVLAMGLLMASLLRPRYREKPWVFWPVGLSIMGVYVMYCTFSVLVAEPKIFGVFELSKVMRGVVFFLATAFYVRTRKELGILVAALACAVLLQGYEGVKQRYLYGIHRVVGTVEDPNSLSMYMCMVCPIFVAAASVDFPKWLRWMCWLCFPVGAVTILLTISRAGVPIYGFVMLGATAFCMTWKITFQKVAVAAVVALAASVAVFKAWDMLMDRYEQATLAEEYLDPTNEGRGVYFRWAGAILDDHVMGVGLNNWSWWVSEKYAAKTGQTHYMSYMDPKIDLMAIDELSAYFAAPAHNLAALTLGELGIPGLIIFLMIWARWFWTGSAFLWRKSDDPMRRIGVGLFFCTCGVFLQSITEWTFRQTPIFITAHVLMGALASLHFTKKWEDREARRLKEAEESGANWDQTRPEEMIIELDVDGNASKPDWR